MAPDSDVVYEWRGEFDNAEVNRLHADGFQHRLLDIDWRTELDSHSLGWVSARRYDELVGFVNVAWDGGVHAFVLDTIVARSARRAGIGAELVARAGRRAGMAGCEWLHVDFENDLRGLLLRCLRVPGDQRRAHPALTRSHSSSLNANPRAR